MCLILFAHDVHPDYRLILVSNRDEFHDRPARPLGVWDDPEGLIGGRDLSAGGAWLAATRDGRWGTVTNYREPPPSPRPPRSRGELVVGYLDGPADPPSHLERLIGTERQYAGFNLLLGNPDGIWWTSNRAGPPTPTRSVEPGVHGLSNELLNTPWPKVVRGREALTRIVKQGPIDSAALFDLVRDDTPASTPATPLAGYPPEWEAALSASFVRTERYGTRASTVMLIDREGSGRMIERRFDAVGRQTGEREVAW